MYLIHITQLLLTTLAITAKELEETNTTFLPYTLKSQKKQDAVLEESLQNIVLSSKNAYSSKDKQALNIYEENSGIIKPLEKNNWERLTTFLSTGPAASNKHADSYLCKTQNLQHSTSLFGSYNFFVAQAIFLLIHFAVLSYILFGGVALFNRLLSLSQPIGLVGNGNFYK
ncbi:uncharacterized protein LOC119603695 [Lucilia sericata]|uniref:uncharacterized protein LOC119603695 n=1 Tax=Lucilia sericata TaxID=13632 RepID=UPI0018A80D23|nr:uncharacterized protein LOC119603695 [Lucilia sericata]